MSLIHHGFAERAVEAEILPALVIAALLLVGALAALTSNLDMGHLAAGLLIGP